jgi:hypothetical protein
VADTCSGHWHYWYVKPDSNFEAMQAALRSRCQEDNGVFRGPIEQEDPVDERVHSTPPSWYQRSQVSPRNQSAPFNADHTSSHTSVAGQHSHVHPRRLTAQTQSGQLRNVNTYANNTNINTYTYTNNTNLNLNINSDNKTDYNTNGATNANKNNTTLSAAYIDPQTTANPNPNPNPNTNTNSINTNGNMEDENSVAAVCRALRAMDELLSSSTAINPTRQHMDTDLLSTNLLSKSLIQSRVNPPEIATASSVHNAPSWRANDFLASGMQSLHMSLLHGDGPRRLQTQQEQLTPLLLQLQQLQLLVQQKEQLILVLLQQAQLILLQPQQQQQQPQNQQKQEQERVQPQQQVIPSYGPLQAYTEELVASPTIPHGQRMGRANHVELERLKDAVKLALALQAQRQELQWQEKPIQQQQH